MKKLIAVLMVCGCSGTTSALLPTRDTPQLTLVWVGKGEAERLEGGAWKRVPDFDYEFTVEQRRFEDRWESVKHLRRLHPAYDGSAGPREQTMHFRLGLEAGAKVRITSTLGDGEGTTDAEFRAAQLTMHPEVSRFAPFDTYRIDQAYRYEEGALEERVELTKGETPWVRNQERATLFAAHRFDAAPTRR